MGLGEVAKTAKSKGKALNTGGGAIRKRKKSPSSDEVMDKAVALGEQIVQTNREVEGLEALIESIQEQIAKTKLGQKLAQIRQELADTRKEIKTLEQEAIPVIKVASPETKRIDLPSGHSLEVEIKVGSKSSANTQKALKEHFGAEEAMKYWDSLEGKETEFLSLAELEGGE